MIKKVLILIAAVFLLSIFSSYAYAQEFNISEEAKKAAEVIKSAELDSIEMQEAGFKITKINDTLNTAKQLYNAQIALEKSGGHSDYTTVNQMVKEIQDTKEKALEYGDELTALKSYIESLKTTGIDVTKAEEKYQQAQGEFNIERYDEAAKLIEEVYDITYKAQSESTTAFAVYKAATETISDFLKKNWQMLVTAAAIIAVTLVLMQNRISVYKTKRNMGKLDLEKSILEGLTKKTQYEYFEKKTMPEETYYIRMKKFGELIRDINRQIPLLKEQLEKKKTKTKKTEKLVDRAGKNIKEEIAKYKEEGSVTKAEAKELEKGTYEKTERMRNFIGNVFGKKTAPEIKPAEETKSSGEKTIGAEKIQKTVGRILHGKPESKIVKKQENEVAKKQPIVSIKIQKKFTKILRGKKTKPENRKKRGKQITIDAEKIHKTVGRILHGKPKPRKTTARKKSSADKIHKTIGRILHGKK